MRLPAIRITISSKCQRLLGRGRPRRIRRAIKGPNFSTQRRSFVGEVEPTLGEQILHVAVVQREAEIEPNRVVNNRRREAVAAIREKGRGERLSHPPLALTPFP
jgi:hypothetical protein